MKLSVFIVFAAVFWYEFIPRSEALPMSNLEMLDLDPETFPEGLIEKTAAPNPSKILAVSDFNLLKHLKVLERNLGRILHSDLDPSITKRDSMRCMVGRVYRPCWEV